METIPRRTFTKQRKQFLQANRINRMGAWNYLQKSSDLPLSTEIIKQTHKTMMEDEKEVLGGGV